MCLFFLCALSLVEQGVQFLVGTEDVRTLVRTFQENLSCIKQGVVELAVMFGEPLGIEVQFKGTAVQDKVDDGAIDLALTKGTGAYLYLVFNGPARCVPLAHIGVKDAIEGLVVVDRLVRTVVRTALPVPRVSALRNVQPFVGQHSLYHAVSS